MPGIGPEDEQQVGREQPQGCGRHSPGLCWSSPLPNSPFPHPTPPERTAGGPWSPGLPAGLERRRDPRLIAGHITPVVEGRQIPSSQKCRL